MEKTFDSIIDKINDFLFDFLGLILPAFVLSMLLIVFPLITFNTTIIDETAKSSFVKNIVMAYSNNAYFTVFTIFVFLYLLGHVIKVLSIYFYKIMEAIFDNFIIANTDRLAKFAGEKFNSDKHLEKHWWFKFILAFKPIYKIVIEIVKQIITFKAVNHHKDSDVFIKIIKENLSNEYKIGEMEWHSIYKTADIITRNRNIKSLSQRFLAKYNFYRSLIVVFVILLLYVVYTYSYHIAIIDSFWKGAEKQFVLGISLFLFTFHYKYKRYWALCGNESLMSLFYFISFGHKEGEKKDAK